MGNSMMVACCNKNNTELDKTVDYPLKSRTQIPHKKRQISKFGHGPDQETPASEPEEGGPSFDSEFLNDEVRLIH